MACTTISALFFLAMLGIVVVGSLLPSTKASPPMKRKEAVAEGILRPPESRVASGSLWRPWTRQRLQLMHAPGWGRSHLLL
jgi:hypothetical protein